MNEYEIGSCDNCGKLLYLNDTPIIQEDLHFCGIECINEYNNIYYEENWMANQGGIIREGRKSKEDYIK